MDGPFPDLLIRPVRPRLTSLQVGWKEKRLLTEIADRDGVMQGDLLAQLFLWFAGLSEVEKLMLVGSDRDGEALAHRYVSRLAEGKNGRSR